MSDKLIENQYLLPLNNHEWYNSFRSSHHSVIDGRQPSCSRLSIPRTSVSRHSERSSHRGALNWKYLFIFMKAVLEKSYSVFVFYWTKKPFAILRIFNEFWIGFANLLCEKAFSLPQFLLLLVLTLSDKILKIPYEISQWIQIKLCWIKALRDLHHSTIISYVRLAYKKFGVK